MKAFSSQGMANKGFWGPSAFNGKSIPYFGNAFPKSASTPSPWVHVYNDPVDTNAMSDVAVISATRVAAITGGGNGAFSTNGGTTWTECAAQPLIAGGSGIGMATDGAVTVVATFLVAGVVKVLRSVNGGQTYTTVAMPAGFTGQIHAPYRMFGVFILFDSSTVTPQVWVSANGLVWAATALSQFFNLGGFSGTKDPFATNGTVAVWVGTNNGNTSGLALHTADAITWTITAVNQIVSSDSVGYDGTDFILIGPQGGGPIYCLSSPDAVTWTLQNTLGSGTVPPYPVQTFFSGTLISGFNGALTNVGRSTDHGHTWVNNALGTTLNNVVEVNNDGTRAFAVGTGILASTDTLTWTQELTFTAAGFIADTRTGAAGVFAFGNDDNGFAAIYRRTSL